MPEIIDTCVICKMPNRYIGWPTVVRSPDGVLYAVFSGDREAHACPGFGKSLLVVSRDGGDHWSEPSVINDTPLDDRDTGLCIAADSTLIMSWFTSYSYGIAEINHAGYLAQGKKLAPWSEWEAKINACSPEDIERWAPFVIRRSAESSAAIARAREELGLAWPPAGYDPRFPLRTRRMGHWTRRSRDGGETWDRPTLSPIYAPHGPAVLPDGNLIYVGACPYRDGNGRQQLGVARSPDQGLSWDLTALVPASFGAPPDVDMLWICEPHVVAAKSGKLVALARAEVPDRLKRGLWQFDSEDGGVTWSTPKPTELIGFPPHLIRTRDGRLLASFSVRQPQESRGHRFCFSRDEGRTWDVDRLLHVPSELGDLGYPATAELDDGTFVSVYYQMHQPREKPCLFMTRWRG